MLSRACANSIPPPAVEEWLVSSVRGAAATSVNTGGLQRLGLWTAMVTLFASGTLAGLIVARPLSPSGRVRDKPKHRHEGRDCATCRVIADSGWPPRWAGGEPAVWFVPGA